MRGLSVLLVIAAIVLGHVEAHAGGPGGAAAGGILDGIGKGILDGYNQSVEDQRKADILAEQRRQFDEIMKAGGTCSMQSIFYENRLVTCRTCCAGPQQCMTSCF